MANGLRCPISNRRDERKRGKGQKKGSGKEREGPAPFRKFLDPPWGPLQKQTTSVRRCH